MQTFLSPLIYTPTTTAPPPLGPSPPPYPQPANAR